MRSYSPLDAEHPARQVARDYATGRSAAELDAAIVQARLMADLVQMAHGYIGAALNELGAARYRAGLTTETEE